MTTAENDQSANAPSRDLIEFAPAKVNLTLHVLRRRADGYHDLESLVAFARIGDRLTLTPGENLALAIGGPTAHASGPADANLVLKAARLLADLVPDLRLGCFILDKQLPVGAGLGGGSSDAAAALRLIARLNAMDAADPRLMAAARATGADVPVCLEPLPRLMRGVGDDLSLPLALPRLPALLVNPAVAIATKDVFAALLLPSGSPSMLSESLSWSGLTRKEWLARLASGRNDLEAPAIALQPVVAEVLALLRTTEQVRIARMTGSGATCFAIYDTLSGAQSAGEQIAASRPGWWVRATLFGG